MNFVSYRNKSRNLDNEEDFINQDLVASRLMVTFTTFVDGQLPHSTDYPSIKQDHKNVYKATKTFSRPQNVFKTTKRLQDLKNFYKTIKSSKTINTFTRPQKRFKTTKRFQDHKVKQDHRHVFKTTKRFQDNKNVYKTTETFSRPQKRLQDH